MKKRLFFGLFLLLLLALFVQASYAQSPVDGFNPDANGSVSVISVQTDGRIIVGGFFTSIGGTARSHIARLNADGSLDMSFNPIADGRVMSIALQTDGKILVGGEFSEIGGTTRNYVARLNIDGSADSSFAPDPDGPVYSIAVLPDGNLLVGGVFTTIGGAAHNNMARLNADGSLDSSFNQNSDGPVLTTGVQVDGKILLGGWFTTIGVTSRNNIARLNADGSLDDSFSPNPDNAVSSIAMQADGKILLGGWFTTIGVTSRNYIARLNSNGSLDSSFNPDASSDVYALTVQADGKILVGGNFTLISGTSRNYIARLNSNGSLDSSFNPDADSGVNFLSVQTDGKILFSGGFTTIGVTSRNYIARLNSNGSLEITLNSNVNGPVYAIAVQADGKILLGGSFTAIGGTTRSNIARLNSDSSLDSSFNPGADDAVNSIAVQADGKILVGGWFTSVGGAVRNRIARLNADGSLDALFDPDADDTVSSILVQADGKILIGGSFTMIGGTARNYIARLNADNSLDTSFNPNADYGVSAMAVQTDGKILIGGAFTTVGGTARNNIARLNANGTLDGSFDPDADYLVSSIAVQADGKILLGGWFTTISGLTRNYIARLNADGSLDGLFDPDANDLVSSIAVQADGMILIGGSFTTIGGLTRNYIARLNAEGYLDPEFDPDADNEVMSLTVQADGKALIGGSFTSVGGVSRNCLARLSSRYAALQDMQTVDNTTIRWLRFGPGPELDNVWFESSTDLSSWSMLGPGSLTLNGWEINGLALPYYSNIYIRARGFARSGYLNSSTSVVELLKLLYLRRATYTSAQSGPWGADSTWVGAVKPPAGSHVVIASGHAVTINSEAVSPFDLTVRSSGSLDVGAYNITVDGLTSVSGTLTHSSATGSKQYNDAVTINSGGTWNNSGNAAVVFRKGLIHNGAAFTAGSGVQTFTTTAVQSIGGSSSLSISRLTIDTGVTLTNSGTLAIGTALAGAGGLTNTGTLTLSGGNGSYSGTTTLTSGTININSSTALGTGTFTISGGSIDNTSAGSITLSTNNAQNWNGNFTFAGTRSLNLGTGAVTMNANRQVTVSASTLTVGGVIGGGSVGLTKAGAGILLLSGANTYTGTTTINAGTLRYGNSNVLSNSSNVVVNDGGTFDVNNFSDTIGSLQVNSGAIGGTVTIGAGASAQLILGGDVTSTGGATNALISGKLSLGASSRTFTVTNSADGLTVSALISNGSITKSGNGTLTLSGANIYSGGTTLNAGQLNINSAAAIGSGTFTISGGIIDNTSGGAITLGNSARNWNGDFTFTGSNALNLGTGAISMNANRQVTVSASTLTAGGTLSAGTRNLTKAGAGTLSFGANTVTLNGLTISAGTLTSTSGTMNLSGDFSNNGTFTHNSGTVTFNSGSSQAINGTSATTFNNLTAEGGGAKTLGNNTTVNGTLTFTSGKITTGANNLIIGSSGTVSGAGADKYVNGSVQKVFPAGAPSFTFPIGDATNYTPALLAFSSVSTGGNVTASATAAEHPDISSSQINSAYSVNRYWTLTNSGIVFTTYDATFNFVSGDVDSGSDTNYFHIEKYAGSAWAALEIGTQTSTSMQATGVSSFSDFAVGASKNFPGDAPTAVKLISFEAVNYDVGVMLNWRTGHEVKNLGFNLYRDAGGQLEQLNAQIIAGSALVAGHKVAVKAGRPYAWLDNAGAGNASYYLEDVDISGKRTMYGPVTPAAANAQQAPMMEQSSTLSSLSSMHTAKKDKTLKLQPRLSSATATGLASVAMTAAMTQEQTQWNLAEAPAVKIFVQEEGWYRITQPELAAYGLGNVDPRYLQLYVNGRQVPMVVSGEGNRRFDPQDYIEFYGMGLDTPSSDTQTYYLIAARSQGLRVKTVTGGTKVIEPSSFAFTVQARPRELYAPALPKNAEGDRFYGPLVSSDPDSPVMVTLNLQHVDQGAASRAVLEVALQGIIEGQHSVVAVMLNNNQVGNVVFDGTTQGRARISLVQTLLQQGDNVVKLIAQNGDLDLSLLDYVHLTYWHTYTADNDVLRFTALGNGKLTVSGFSTPGIRIMDITAPNSVKEVSRKVITQGSTYAASFNVPSTGTRTLLAFNDHGILNPAAITSNTPSALHAPNNGADMVIITDRSLMSALTPLKQFREAQGRAVAIVDVEDIYDEFSFGIKTPEAIQDFLYRASTAWTKKPRFVLLSGDATVDARDYLGYGQLDRVPTNIVDGFYSEAVSDDLFADFNGDGLPEMAVGRIPAAEASEVATVVSKIIGYEQAAPGAWTKKAVLVADNDPEVFDFEGGNDEIAAMITPYMTSGVTKLYRRDGATTQDLLTSINAGALIVNYLGHGSEDTWGGNILVAADADSLTNGLMLPFFMNMTCWNGHFASPYMASLGETLLKSGSGGAIAVWASSGLTEPEPQHDMNRQMITLLMNSPGLTIGEASVKAKAASTDMDVRRTWILMGDPLIRLK